MALNLTRELAKSSYLRKNKKSLVVNKVKNDENEDLIRKNNILFEDPNTFLQLPNETNFDYIINKIPRGPQFDFDDKIIPYTMVGNPKYLKGNKYLNSSKSTSKKASFISKMKDPSIIRINNINNYYNIISDKEIKEIFTNYKNKINENKTKYKTDLISNSDCPKTMKQYIDKNLELQENCLKKNKNNISKFKNMKNYIQQRMKLNEKSKRNKSELRNHSMKDINITFGELVMNSGDDYRIKNEAKNIIENSKNNFPNVNQNWEMSLRRPNHFVGTRKEILNYGTAKNPFYSIATERNDKLFEITSKPRRDFNYSSIGVLSSRTSSIQNLFNLELKKNNTNDDILRNYIKRNTICEKLEVQGQRLIDFEENICKKLKGKKKLLNIKNNKEEVKDMMIYADYTYNK